MRDLKGLVADGDKSISTALRRTSIVAREIGYQPLVQWLAQELNGYSKDETPDYRRVAVPSLGTFSGAFQSKVDNQVLPLSHLPDEVAEALASESFCQPIGELEALTQDMTEDRVIKWPAEAVILARKFIQMEGMVLVDAWRPVPRYKIAGIVDVVRNRLLDFLLELEQMNPEILVDTKDAASELELSQVGQLFNVTIVGGSADFSQQQEKYMTRDRYEVGQAGSVGPNSKASDMTFQQVWQKAGSALDLDLLRSELEKLRSHSKSEASSAAQDRAVGEVAAAEEALSNKDGPRALRHLAKAGKWMLANAEKLGLSVATAAIKTSLGL